ncbi:unnamed protein product [Linum tenue]|uniref:Uncharacterized protein n=1 Tax=Linum tenue TaxID=586396 RepID=A0AAV0KDZ4_9ROSI|nr:unnamed protein product [Linum tenue]CAI0426073.1 unnamed protein product [Linum tenue]CAI0426092.1 unnamed protein product [Linum tenue]
MVRLKPYSVRMMAVMMNKLWNMRTERVRVICGLLLLLLLEGTPTEVKECTLKGRMD